MDLTVQDAGDLLIWIGAICAALVAIGAAGHAFIVRPLRGFLVREIGEVTRGQRETTERLQTSNGKTVAEYVEGSAAALDDIRDELRQTNKLALQNQVEIMALGRRVDDHLLRDHTAR